MSVLSKEAGDRIVALIHAPLPQHAEVASAWAAGARVEYRYVLGPEHDDINQWCEIEREGHDFHLGGHWICEPNWQAEELEFRVKP